MTVRLGFFGLSQHPSFGYRAFGLGESQSPAQASPSPGPRRIAHRRCDVGTPECAEVPANGLIEWFGRGRTGSELTRGMSLAFPRERRIGVHHTLRVSIHDAASMRGAVEPLSDAGSSVHRAATGLP